MAWTAPMTFVDSTPLTAAQLNTHLRDNLLETAPAKATTPGGYFVTQTVHSIVERVPQGQTISTSNTTDSTSYTNLSNPGPSVTVTTGAQALVIVGCEMANSGGGASRMSYEIAGASTLEAIDRFAVQTSGTNYVQTSYAAFRTDLTPGVNTFNAMYRVSSGTGTFLRRRIVVFPY